MSMRVFFVMSKELLVLNKSKETMLELKIINSDCWNNNCILVTLGGCFKKLSHSTLIGHHGVGFEEGLLTSLEEEEQRVKKLEKQRRSKSLGLKRLRKVGTSQRVESSAKTVVGAQEDASKQGERTERKDDDNAADKEVNAAEPTVFNDEEMQEKHLDNIQKYQSLKRKPISVAQTKKNMIVYLKNMAGYKMEHFKGMSYDKKLRAEVEVSGSESTQDTPTIDPKEMSEEDVQNMLQIVPMSEFKVEALQVKYPLIDWEIHSKGSRTYWKIIKVGGITQAYQSFEDMLKVFDREDLDALWRLVKEKFSTTIPTEDKDKAL
nr:hypothetical protein [Tanacetum cinerariifolium]